MAKEKFSIGRTARWFLAGAVLGGTILFVTNNNHKQYQPKIPEPKQPSKQHLEQKITEPNKNQNTNQESIDKSIDKSINENINLRSINYKTADFSDDTDEILLARMLFGEARNCSYEEKIAVAYTALNRIDDGKKWNGETLREVILCPWQYSCFNQNDVNKEKLMNPQDYDGKSFHECLRAAKEILSGQHTDLTGGATHYFNPQVVQPSWANKMIKIGKLKTKKGLTKHEFYREKLK